MITLTGFQVILLLLMEFASGFGWIPHLAMSEQEDRDVRLPLLVMRPNLAVRWGVGYLSHILVALVSAAWKIHDTQRKNDNANHNNNPISIAWKQDPPANKDQ